MESSRWKKILPELLAVILCLGIMCVGVSFKEGYHMDELLSFELANARYNPWIVPTQPEGRLAKFVREEIQGDSFPETVSNLTETVKDVLQNRGNSKLLSYKADVYEEPVWISAEQFRDYVTVDGDDAFDYLSVYFNVKDDNHPPVHFMLLHTMSSLFVTATGQTACRYFFHAGKGQTAGNSGSAAIWTQHRSTGNGTADPDVRTVVLSVCGVAFCACGEVEGSWIRPEK